MMTQDRMDLPERRDNSLPSRLRDSPFVRIAGYGLASWFVPFAVAMAMYPLRMTNRALFESAFAVVLAGTVVATTTALLARVSSNFVSYGMRCGAVWVLQCQLLDAIAYSVGPMQLTLLDYVYDIGVTYLMIPLVTLGLAWQRHLARERGNR